MLKNSERVELYSIIEKNAHQQRWAFCILVILEQNYSLLTFYGTKGAIICNIVEDHITVFNGGDDVYLCKGKFTTPQLIEVWLASHNVAAEIEMFLTALSNFVI